MKPRWTYRKLANKTEATDELAQEACALPPGGTAYLAFDALRWSIVIGYTEKGGYSSILSPNVCDDCQIIAFAPLSETSEPDSAQLLECWPIGEDSKGIFPNLPSLLR